ncbi:hypothetical protein CPB84DRAFT_1852470 [Gymnopilus junonius]|uniref:Uncharacterized protein n=1 Tax=Gymnopilus junonius TaxID=109634 RepID=A0A9P5THV8_GYMJU|nr:hypothetical protein CPB84DRAFT_1852470 [Gymnopilus junonius]
MTAAIDKTLSDMSMSENEEDSLPQENQEQLPTIWDIYPCNAESYNAILGSVAGDETVTWLSTIEATVNQLLIYPVFCSHDRVTLEHLLSQLHAAIALQWGAEDTGSETNIPMSFFEMAQAAFVAKRNGANLEALAVNDTCFEVFLELAVDRENSEAMQRLTREATTQILQVEAACWRLSISNHLVEANAMLMCTGEIAMNVDQLGIGNESRVIQTLVEWLEEQMRHL